MNMKKIIIGLILAFLLFSAPIITNGKTQAECTGLCAHITDIDANSKCIAECLAGNIVNKEQITDLVIRIAKWFYGIVLALAIIFLALAGLQYFTAGGDEQKLTAAKRNSLYAIIGIAILLGSWLIIVLISNILGVEQPKYPF